MYDIDGYPVKGAAGAGGQTLDAGVCPGAGPPQTSLSGQTPSLTGLPVSLPDRAGHTVAMTDELWLEASAHVQSDDEADLRAEAAEVFLAEAARTRLEDHAGPVRITLRSGRVIDGQLVADDPVAGHLCVADADGGQTRVPIGAIDHVTGSHPALRDEVRVARTLTSWLRDCWRLGDAIAVLNRSGRWHRGTIDFVGADHVVLLADGGTVTIPFPAVDAWRC